MKPFLLLIPESHLEMLELIVKDGYYSSISATIRAAIWDLIREHNIIEKWKEKKT